MGFLDELRWDRERERLLRENSSLRGKLHQTEERLRAVMDEATRLLERPAPPVIRVPLEERIPVAMVSHWEVAPETTEIKWRTFVKEIWYREIARTTEPQ